MSANIAAPTHARRWVLVLSFFAAALTYLDRISISAAAPSIQKDLGISTVEMGYVFSIFALAYALFEIPAGWMGDHWGQRKVMTRIVACWSIFTVLTGTVRSFSVLLVTRFVFGAAEAGAFPTLSRSLARWFPPTERARANGFMWMGARLGGATAPVLAVALIVAVGWRSSFAIFGAVGLIWCAIFWTWFRDDPRDHAGVNAAELAHITSGAKPQPRHPGTAPWREIFSSGNMWSLFGMYFCASYGFYFFQTWLPTYLVKDHGLTLAKSGLYAALPLSAGALGCLGGGILSDWLVRRTSSIKWSRRLMGMSGYLLACVGFGLAAMARDPLTAMLCLTFASGFHDFTLPVSWATVTDIGGRFGGATGAFMNMASSLSAMVSSTTAALLATSFGNFNAARVVAAGSYFIGGMLWLRIDPTKCVGDQGTAQSINGQ